MESSSSFGVWAYASPPAILTGKGFVRSRAAEEMKFLSHECGQFLSVGIQIGQ